MKLKSFALTAAAVAWPLFIASAQSPDPAGTTNAINPEAMRLLRQVIAEQQRNPDRIIRVPASTNTVSVSPTKVELEKQYLSGQLSAKQYQKALDRLAKEEKKRLEEAEKQHKREAQEAAAKVATKSAAPVQPVPKVEAAVKPAPAPAPVEPTAEQRKLTDVEQRIDAMMKQKAEREKAAAAATSSTNSAPNAAQTKRQRLDALLKQVIDGKLSDSDYKAQRSKILAEPD